MAFQRSGRIGKTRDFTLRKAACVACAAAMAMTVVTGCSQKAASSGKADTSKAVQLQFYMVGDAPKDLPAVSDKINAMAKKDLNCTVKYNFTTWTDYSQKYDLLISSGESIDLLYTAPWLSYGIYAKKGAFQDLNSMLPKAAPDLYKYVPKSDWDLCKLDGKIYTIPAMYQEYISNGLMYREDLRKKYDLPVPNTWENCEKYMAGIKKNMPGQMVTNSKGSDFLFLQDKYYGNGYGIEYNYYEPTKLISVWGTDRFTKQMKDIKSWGDQGFWSKSILSDKSDANAFIDGQIVIEVGGLNPQKYITAKQNIKTNHPDWEVGFIPESDANGVCYVNHPLHNGYAVPVTSKNPERALMFYQKMVLDKTYNQLTQYGVEGTNYKMDNGVYTQVGDGFGFEGMNGWSWRNPEFMVKTNSTDDLQAVFKNLDKVAAEHPAKYKADLIEGFTEDTSSYENEKAAVDSVVTQYLNPMMYGEAPNVDTAMKTFLEKVKAAGLEKVNSGWKTQWLAYCKEHDY